VAIKELLLTVEDSLSVLLPWCQESGEDVEDRQGIDEMSSWNCGGGELLKKSTLRTNVSDSYFGTTSRQRGVLTMSATAGSVFRLARLLKAICIIREPAYRWQ
jgi:hypothetical protein